MTAKIDPAFYLLLNKEMVRLSSEEKIMETKKIWLRRHITIVISYLFLYGCKLDVGKKSDEIVPIENRGASQSLASVEKPLVDASTAKQNVGASEAKPSVGGTTQSNNTTASDFIPVTDLILWWKVADKDLAVPGNFFDSVYAEFESKGFHMSYFNNKLKEIEQRIQNDAIKRLEVQNDLIKNCLQVGRTDCYSVYASDPVVEDANKLLLFFISDIGKMGSESTTTFSWKQSNFYHEFFNTKNKYPQSDIARLFGEINGEAIYYFKI